MKRGLAWDHFLQSGLAREAVWDRLFPKEFGMVGFRLSHNLSKKKTEMCPKWTSGHRFGHLLVQNGTQEVQERHGTAQDTQNPNKK